MATGNIKGIVVEIGGNTGPLDKALQGVNKTSRDLQSELKEVNKGLKFDPTNTVLLEQKQKLLAESITTTKGKLDTLKLAESQAQEQFKQGKIGEENYRNLQREVVETEQKLKGLETQAKKVNGALTSDQAIGNLKSIGKAVGVAALAAGAGFVGVGVAAVNNADELQKQADITGLSAERLQELSYAGNNLGVDLEIITGAQAKLTKTMNAAAEGKGGPNAQAKAFNELGIKVRDSSGNLRDSKTVMSEAFTALNGVGNETERDALAMTIFGKSAMAMNPLIKAGGDELNRLSTEAQNNGAVMSNEAVAGLDKFGDTMENIKTSILGNLGEKLADLMPKIQEFIDKLMAIPQWIQDNSTLLTIIGIVLGTFTLAIVAYNIAVGWAAITTGIMTMAAGAFAAVLAFLTSPITIIILAIGALIAIGVLLYKNWDTVSAFLSSIWNSIATTATNVFNGIVNGIKDFGVRVWTWVTVDLPTIIMKFVEWFASLPEKIAYALGFVIGSIIKFGVDAVKWVVTEVPKFIESFVNFFKELPGKIWNTLLDIMQKIHDFEWSIINWVLVNVPKFLNSFVNFFKNLPGKIWDALISIMQKIHDFEWSIIDWITTNVPKFIKQFVDFFTALPGNIADVGKNIITGLWNGISGAWGWLKDKVTGLFGGLVQGIKDGLGIKSPSKIFAEIGGNLSEGLAIGISNKTKMVTDQLKNLAKSITGNITNTVEGLSSDVNIGMNLTPSMAGIGSMTRQGTMPGGDTIINFNGSYSFAGQQDIDYFMNKAAVLVKRRT